MKSEKHCIALSWKFLLSFLVLASLFCLDANHITFASTISSSASTCLQPPAHIDVSKLSDAQLDAYGIPPHAILQSDPQWNSRLANYKTRSCSTHPYQRLKQTSTLSPNTRFVANNWAGNQAKGGGYTHVDGYWNIPAMNTGVRSSTASVWVGLGRGNSISDPLVQTGIDNNVNFLGFVSYYVWVEVYYNNGTASGHDDQLGVTFNQGLNTSDHIEAYVSKAAGKNFYWLQNNRTGEVISPNNIPSPSNGHWPLSNGSTAEWIVEKLSNTLANYNYINFSQCSVGPNDTYVNQEPHDYYETYQGTQEIQWVGPITGNGNFIVHYGHS